MSCLIGLASNEEARQAVISYFQTNYSLSHEVIWPNQKPPSIEDRDDPFILLDFLSVSKEQEYIGSSEYITDKALVIELWVKEYTGSKTATLFEDFVNTLGLTIQDGVQYKVPKVMDTKNFKGWELTSATLPFTF